ncbi:copper ion binding protein [Neisseriaceae bacterium TC5R-5]|nr:copper ion binding protein [Neisseriaceae bacterium TC5R-5]
MTELILQVEGMSCQACVNSVSKVLGTMAGVSEVEVQLAAKQARVLYDAAVVSPEELAAAVTDAGFDAGL